jgi:hypothetical protein
MYRIKKLKNLPSPIKRAAEPLTERIIIFVLTKSYYYISELQMIALGLRPLQKEQQLVYYVLN